MVASGSAPMFFIFGTRIPLNVALRDPKVKCTRGKLHMLAHDNLTTRDESVKRGGGSVVVLGNSQNNIKVPQIRYLGKSMCS